MPVVTIDGGSVVCMADLAEGLAGQARPVSPESLDELSRLYFPCRVQSLLNELVRQASCEPAAHHPP